MDMTLDHLAESRFARFYVGGDGIQGIPPVNAA
jgi:hypothetical protein